MSALRELLVYFGTEVDTKPLEKANDLLATVKKAAIGLAAGWSFAKLVSEFTSVGVAVDDVADTSAKLGFSTKALQEWRYVAKLSGIEAGALDGALRKANMAIAGAAKSADGAKKFDELGVSLTDANGAARATEQVFGDTITQLAAMTDKQKRSAAASEIFGRSFTELAPLLEQGAEGIAKLKAEIGANGGIFSDSDVANIGALNDELDKFEVVTMGVKARLAGALAPAIAAVARWITRAVSTTQKWGASFKDWVKTSVPLRNAIRFVGSLLGVIVARSGPGVLVKGITAFAGKWGLVRGFIMRAVAVLGRFIMRMLIPALLLDDLIVTFQGGDSVIRRILDGWFGEGTVANIVNWFASWTGGLDELQYRFSGFLDFILVTIDTLSFEIDALMLGLAAAIADGAMAAWNAVLGAAESGLNALIELANKIPGVDMGKADFSGARGDTDHGEQVANALGAQRIGVAERLESSASRAFGAMPGTGGAVAAPQVNVTVPPGTPATMANRVGAAAARGTTQGVKAASRALTQKKA